MATCWNFRLFFCRVQDPEALDRHEWNVDDRDQLNHDHSKDRLRVAKTGRVVARKPPTRQGSNSNLIAGQCDVIQGHRLDNGVGCLWYSYDGLFPQCTSDFVEVTKALNCEM